MTVLFPDPMQWIISLLIGITVVLILLVTMVFIYRKDRDLVLDIGRSLRMKIRLSVFRGWIAESKQPSSKIFISSMEEATPDGNTLLIFITFDRASSFPLVISNHKSIISGFAFERPGTRVRGLKRFEYPPLENKKLHIYCRPEDRSKCRSLLNRFLKELDRFTSFCNGIDAVFHIGTSRLRIGADSRSKPSDIKKLYEMAISLLRAAGMI